jgi:deoxycytidylate deaminase
MSQEFIEKKFTDSELIIGFVGAVGTELDMVINELKNRLKTFKYTANEIRISKDIIPQLIDVSKTKITNEYERISSYMTAGNKARKLSSDNSVLALGAIAKINEWRPNGLDIAPYKPRNSYILNSLKHPQEVERLREIYKEGFYLIGVYSDKKRREKYLKEDKRIKLSLVNELIERDADEQIPCGQRTSDTFHLSDFFIRIEENHEKWKNSLWRILDIIFGHPYRTPDFDEFAMFLAYTASLRSADLSRQVGAVITKNSEIIATGANDCPKFGGGLYWPEYNPESFKIEDQKRGRDYKRGSDSNQIEKDKIINNIIEYLKNSGANSEEIRKALKKSGLQDITEYGRMVHAEMEALLSCSRNNISTRDATLYCTTFPCHNCAKHIIAAGIKRVVYVEPYPKSKAPIFHDDSISFGFSKDNETVHFEPFVGIGPRRFFDLFSMNLGSGYPLKRKNGNGSIVEWKQEQAKLRIQMFPSPYFENEALATDMFNTYRKEITNERDKS